MEGNSVMVFVLMIFLILWIIIGFGVVYILLKAKKVLEVVQQQVSEASEYTYKFKQVLNSALKNKQLAVSLLSGLLIIKNFIRKRKNKQA